MSSGISEVQQLVRELGDPDLVAEFSKGPLGRYSEVITRFIDSGGAARYLVARKIATGALIILPLTAPFLALIVAESEPDLLVQGVLWGLWFVLIVGAIAVGLVVTVDYELFHERVKGLRRLDDIERLLAQSALFSRIPEQSIAYDDETVARVSKLVPVLEERFREKVEHSRDKDAKHEDFRENDVELFDIGIDEPTRDRLQDLTRLIVDLSSILFGGRHYSAKLYLLVRMDFDNEPLELLVSFARYPPDLKNVFGSSWLRSESPVLVWQALIEGRTQLADTSSLELGYERLLTVCLPGRVGVLAITSSEEDGFDRLVLEQANQPRSLFIRPVALAAWHVLSDALQLFDDANGDPNGNG